MWQYPLKIIVKNTQNKIKLHQSNSSDGLLSCLICIYSVVYGQLLGHKYSDGYVSLTNYPKYTRECV